MDLNPSSNFLKILFKPGSYGRIWVITGDHGAGKTVLCQQIVSHARNAGLHVSGILSPSRFENGQRTGMYVNCLENDETRLLASLVTNEIHGRKFGPWMFDPKIFTWGNVYLSSLMNYRTELLFIDELGNLEFDFHEGWISGFDVLSRGIFNEAVVVIRPECIQSFAKMGYQFTILDVSNGLPIDLV